MFRILEWRKGGHATTGGQNTRIPDFNTAHADEIRFTFEHEIMADLGFRFTYVRKQHRNEWTGFNMLNTPQYLTQPWQYTCDGCGGEFEGRVLRMVTVPDDLAFQQDSVLTTVYPLPNGTKGGEGMRTLVSP
jgi:hypothetical protein